MLRPKSIHKVVFIRHGQSVWNLDNRFTGWHDVGLTEHGVKEATIAGEILRRKGFEFDMAFTSVLNRAILTYNIVAKEIDQMWVPHIKHWRLNERHYGAL